MNDQQNLSEFFSGILDQARRGELNFEVLGTLLDKLVEAGNYPVAALLYGEWHKHQRSGIRPAEYAKASQTWKKLKAQTPDIPELPSATDLPTTVDETSYQLGGNFDDGPAAKALRAAYTRAMALDHKLPSNVVRLRGMSGMKYRYLINRLVEATPDARYLEVGSWAGSTACAAAWGNSVKALCIDNWSEFGGPRDEFLVNIGQVRSSTTLIEFIESDFRTVDFAGIGRFNVYLFDGPHAEQDQYDGVVLAQPALDDEFTLIVDDWNWPAVRQGTQRAITELGLTVVCSVEVRTTQNNGAPQQWLFEKSEWHNGYFIAVCRKQRARSGPRRTRSA